MATVDICRSDAPKIRKESIKIYDVSERTPHGKSVSKFLYEICEKNIPSQYKVANGIMFHPDDPMPQNDSCYVSRA